jgi:hypothetical protein
VPATGFPEPFFAPETASPAPVELLPDTTATGGIQENRRRDPLAETGPFARVSAILGVLDPVALQVVDGILDGAEGPGLVIGNLQLLVVSGELFFEGHD